MRRSTDNPWLHRFAVLTAAATLFLICVGGMVTSRGAGMAVPDWPNTYGYNMFFFPVSQWVGGIFYEHTHRLVASGVGLLTVILALWLHGERSRPVLRWGGAFCLAAGLVLVVAARARWQDAIVMGLVGVAGLVFGRFWPGAAPAARWLRRLGVIAVVLVIVQGVLGGLRVALFKDEIGIFHAALAQVFFVLIGSIALFTSRWWKSPHPEGAEGDPRVRAFVLAGTLLIFVQLALGATMRHQHAGLAIPDFPLAYGKLWPAMDAASVADYNRNRLEANAAHPITAFQIGLQMAHRIVAVVIVAVVIGAARTIRRRIPSAGLLVGLSKAWLWLILVQVGLGAATIWSGKSADVATAHVGVGALSLLVGSSLVLLAYRSAFPEQDPARGVACGSDAGNIEGISTQASHVR